MRIFGIILVIISFINITYKSNSDEFICVTNIDKIGIEVLNRINPISIKNDYEYGGTIYMKSDGMIVATSPHTDKEPHKLMIPSLWTLHLKGHQIARYHTHGAESEHYDDESFSEVDTSNVGVDQYLMTPKWHIFKFDCHNRRVYKYNPASDIWTILPPSPPKPEEEYFPPLPKLELYYKMPWLYNPNLINF